MSWKILNYTLNSSEKVFISSSRFKSSVIGISRIKRSIYPHMPIVKLVKPDGSVVRIRYDEPRLSIRMPVDLNNCSEEYKRNIMILRAPVTKLNIDEEIKTTFDLNDYSYLWKKK